MKTYVLPYGKGNQTVDLPEDHVLYDLHGPGTNAIEDEEQAVRDALRHPVGSSPLEDIIEPSDTVWTPPVKRTGTDTLWRIAEDISRKYPGSV